MYTIGTINEEFEIFTGIVDLYNQNNSEIFGKTIKLGELPNSGC